MKDKQFWSVAGIIFVLFMIYWFAGHPYFVSERSVMFWSILIVGGVLIYS
ncbi:MAG: hypothetical protein HOG80_00495, partial [Candidatus Marinimicrobia bacterium]|nr:hypothetical protein [Candidatus Neomarinimicrobiota bacterium]